MNLQLLRPSETAALKGNDWFEIDRMEFDGRWKKSVCWFSDAIKWGGGGDFYECSVLAVMENIQQGRQKPTPTNRWNNRRGKANCIKLTPADCNCEKTAENLVEMSIYLFLPFRTIDVSVRIFNLSFPFLALSLSFTDISISSMNSSTLDWFFYVLKFQRDRWFVIKLFTLLFIDFTIDSMGSSIMKLSNRLEWMYGESCLDPSSWKFLR